MPVMAFMINPPSLRLHARTRDIGAQQEEIHQGVDKSCPSKSARSLEAAIADQVAGQETRLSDPALPDRRDRFDRSCFAPGGFGMVTSPDGLLG
jgi:hypothetical protein